MLDLLDRRRREARPPVAANPHVKPDRTHRLVDELAPRRRFDAYEQAEAMARRRLPRPIFDKISAGADRGLTHTANVDAFAHVQFRPRGAAAPPDRDVSTVVLGTAVSMPVLLAPVGALRLVHPDGALAAAEAATASGTICAISPGAGHSFDDIAAAAIAGPKWWQISTSAGRAAAEQMIADATTHAYDALVVTIDSSVKPKAKPVRLDARTVAELAPDLVRRPLWTARFVRDGMRINLANAALGPQNGGPPVTWADFGWIHDQWRGPLVVKGVLIADDARRAVDVGADAIVVSNHGGLVLDGARPTLRALPEVVAAVGAHVEVLVDGGIRSGADVVKALALGARATLIGRAYLMALAVGGSSGVHRMLELFRTDIDRTIALLGCASLADVGADHVESSCTAQSLIERRRG